MEWRNYLWVLKNFQISLAYYIYLWNIILRDFYSAFSKFLKLHSQWESRNYMLKSSHYDTKTAPKYFRLVSLFLTLTRLWPIRKTYFSTKLYEVNLKLKTKPLEPISKLMLLIYTVFFPTIGASPFQYTVLPWNNLGKLCQIICF